MDIALLLPLLLLVVMIIFMWRSNKKRTEQQNTMRAKIQPGVEVMTQAGIFGTLISVDEAENVATIETSPGVLLRVHSATIANVVEPTLAVPDDASELTGGAVIDDATAEESLDTDRRRDTDNDMNDSDDDRRDNPKA